jgi:LysR family transcriptional regulator (chromosome initiation inhibitor)
LRVAIAANADSLATWLVPALARIETTVGVEIEVIRDDQNYSVEWLRSGRVLGAITSEARPVQGCRVQPLGAMRCRASASPVFVKRWFAKGATAAAFAQATAIAFDRQDLLQHEFVRKLLRARRVSLLMLYLPSPAQLLGRKPAFSHDG